MRANNINKKIVDSYLELLNNLSTNNKLDLIAGLSDSLKSDDEIAEKSFRISGGNFIPEKSADELIADLKQARIFTRKNESF